MGDKDPLLAAICHDLRAPLAAVTMGANFVLQTTPRDDASARSVKILEAVLRSCSQMERLIRNLGDLSEIEAGGVTLRVGLHDAGAMLDLTAESFAEAAQARSVVIEVRAPRVPITASCDRERLLRALGHVTDNAVRHAPEGSTVTLSVARGDDDVAFTVTDRGDGLTAELRGHIFDRQWHARRANRAGAGCGLAIARGFLEAHRGGVIVAPDAGGPTTFTLRLPLVQ